MRMDLLYLNAKKFCTTVSKIQQEIAKMKKSASNFERNVINYVLNRLIEIKCQMRFSRLLFDTGLRSVVNDVDKIVRVGNRFAGIFELKVRRDERFIKINFVQLQTFRYLTSLESRFTISSSCQRTGISFSKLTALRTRIL